MNGASEPPPLSAKSLTGKLNRFTYLVAVRNAVRKVFHVRFFPKYNTTSLEFAVLIMKIRLLNFWDNNKLTLNFKI